MSCIRDNGVLRALCLVYESYHRICYCVSYIIQTSADSLPGRLLRLLSAYASKQIARPHSPAVVLKARARSLPTKILDILKYGHIQSQGCKSAKQQGLAP